MAEELQNLLERIQRDGVEKAESEAAAIVSTARDQAATLLVDARKAAEALIQKAQQQSETYTTQSTRSLEQAARDVVLSVREAITQTLRVLVANDVRQSLNGETLRQMLVAATDAYFLDLTGERKVVLLLSAEEQQKLTEFFMSRYADALRKGLTIESDRSVVAGFRVSVVDEQVQHDFTVEAITEALVGFLRPQLADVVRKAAPHVA